MTGTSFPYTSQPTTDIEYSRLFRELQDTGVVGDSSGSALLGYANSTGMKTFIPDGEAIVRGFFYRNVGAIEMTHATAVGARVDRVVLRLDVSAPTAAQRIVPVILKGADGVTTPPALTQTDTGIFELPLYSVIIDAGATSIPAGKVLSERRFVGSFVGSWTTDLRPTNPRKGKMGFNETLSVVEMWNGAAWKHVADGVAWAGVTGKPTTSTLDGRKIFVQDPAPTSSLGVDGDICLEY